MRLTVHYHKESLNPYKLPFMLKRLFILFIALSLLALAAGMGAFAFLPTLAASDWARRQAQARLSAMVGLPVTVGGMRLQWGQGIELRDCRMGRAPELFACKRLAFFWRRSSIWSPRIDVDVDIDQPSARVIRDAQGRLNIAGLQDRLESARQRKPAAPPAAKESFSLNFPINIGFKINLAGGQLVWDDRSASHWMGLKDAQLRCWSGAIQNQPIEFDFKGLISIDQTNWSGLGLTATVDKWLTSKGELSLDTLILAVESHFPGGVMAAHAAGATGPVQAHLALDLLTALNWARPVVDLPIRIAPSNAHLDVNFSGQRQAGGNIDFSAHVGIADLRIEDPLVGPLTISLNAGGRIDPTRQRISLDTLTADIPDTLTMTGRARLDMMPDLPDQAIDAQAQVEVDVKRVYQLLAPLLPNLPIERPGGRIKLAVDARGRMPGVVQLDLKMDTKAVAAAIATIDFMPLDMLLTSRAGVSWPLARIDIDDCRLQTSYGVNLAAQAGMTGLDDASVQIHARLSDISIDMAALAASIGQAADLPRLNGTVKIAGMQIQDLTPDGAGRVQIDHAAIDLPALVLGTGPQAIDIEMGGVHIRQSAVDLADWQPRQARVALTAAVGKISAGHVVVRQAQIHQFDLTANDIQLQADALLGVSAQLALTEAMTINQISMADRMDGRNMTQRLQVTCRLPATGRPRIRLEDFAFNAAAVSLPPADRHITGPVGLQAKVDQCFWPDNEFSTPRLTGIDLTLDLLQALDLRLRGQAGTGAGQPFSLDGSVDMDLSLLLAMAGPSRNSLPRVDGAARIDWQANGRFPTDAQVKAIDWQTQSDPSTKLSFIDKISISSRLDHVAFYPPAGRQWPVAGIHLATQRPVAYAFTGADSAGKLGAGITFTELMPQSHAGQRPAMTGRIDLDLTHERLDALTMNEQLELPGASLRQSLSVSIDGLADLIRQPARWTELAGGHAVFKIAVQPREADKLIVGKVSLMGDYDLSTDITLQPRHGMDLNWKLNADRADIKTIDGRVAVHQLDAHLNGRKRYQFKLNTKPDQSAATGLTRQVLAPQTPQPADWPARSIRMPMADEAPNIRADRIVLSRAGAPIEISRLRAALRFENGLPQAPFLQADLLGGSLRASVDLTQSDAGFQLGVTLPFSNIDGAHLTPRADSADRRVSGRLTARMPLLASAPQMARRMRLGLDLNRIGPRALDAFLLAVDPTESNETIVGQRRLLKHGVPKSIRLQIIDGMLYLHGRVDVKGVLMDLPVIERLSVADLPGLDRLNVRLQPLAEAEPLLMRISSPIWPW